ncbi:MAG TPA: hypothetical protein VGO40_09695 [Longimicrobium sp.]|nr:hypothetical protein [Longimicrobium sp.]
MSAKPRPFELFLASFMTEAEASALLAERAGVSSKALPAFRAEEDADGFWAPLSLSYFEERLRPMGYDTTFAVALPLEPGTRRHRFALSLWPDFELGVLTGPDSVPFYPHFVRRPGAEALLPADLRTILPWSATLEEILARFGPPLSENAWDLRRWVVYGVGVEKWIMTFDLGLLQNVHWGR